MAHPGVITIVLLADAERNFAEAVGKAIQRISSLRRNCAFGGILAPLAASVLGTHYHRWQIWFSSVVSREWQFPILIWGMIAIAVVGWTLWYLLYARFGIRWQIAVLGELAARPEMQHIRRKLYQMKDTSEKLAWAVSLESKLTSTAPRSVRRLFPKPIRG